MRPELKSGRGKRLGALSAVLLAGSAGLYFAAGSRVVGAPKAPLAVAPAHVAPGPSAGSGRHDRVSQRTSKSTRPLVSGRVQTVTGAALAGASVCVVPLAVACCEAMSCTRSDADGKFVLEYQGTPSAMLLASRVGYLPSNQELQSPIGVAPVLLTLEAGGVRVAGVVVDATGGPIAGAGLSALGAQEEVLGVGVSDSSGVFRLDVPSGALRIRARADGYSEQVRAVQAPALGLRLALTPASGIVGRTVSEDGAPVPGVRVMAHGRDGLWAAPAAAQSGDDGMFRLKDLAAGRYALSAVSERWRSEEHSVHVGLAQTTQLIELVLQAATTLTAAVKVAGGPCTEGSVSLSGAVGGYAPLARDGQAVFEGLIPGRYRVSVECEAGLDQSDWVEIDGEPVTRVWELEAGLRVTGVALTPAGAPVRGARIEVNPVGEPFGRSATHCTTDERGEFSCAGLMPGEYECAIGHGASQRSDIVQVALTEGAAPRVVLHTHGEGAIRARIQDAEQLELQAVPLVARGKAGTSFGKLEGDEFVFEPLALGRYEIASQQSAPGSGRLVELTRAGQVAALTLALPSPHTLSGRVVGDDGQPIPDAWVRAILVSLDARVRPVTPVLTDGDGAFSLAGLLPGRYRLTASSAQGEAQLDDIASDGRDVVLRLASYGSIAVSLRSAAGDPVSEFLVAYRRSEDESAQQAPGARGAWSAPWVPPGRYELTAKAAEGSVRTNLELPPGGQVSVALRLDVRGHD